MTPSSDSYTRTRSRLLAQVPPFRPVAVQLLRIVGLPDVPLARIVDLLRADPVMTAEILGLANSPLLDSRYEIKTVLHALAILGLNRVNALILTAAMRSLVDTRRSALSQLCWRHSVTTALTCEQLAETLSLPKESSYTAGLIHDIGQLALLRAYPEYERAMPLAVEEGRNLLEAERQLFQMDHCEAGRWLLGQWGCPLELQNVAALHENPPASDTRDGSVIGLVHAGSQVADLIGMSVFPSAPHHELIGITASYSEATQERLLARFPKMVERVIAKLAAVESSLC